MSGPQKPSDSGQNTFPPTYSQAVRDNQHQQTGNSTQNATTIHQASIVFDQNPLNCQCSYCGEQILTRTLRKPGILAWLMCGLLSILGLICCFWIPFVVDAFKDTQHLCPKCGRCLGYHKII